MTELSPGETDSFPNLARYEAIRGLSEVGRRY